MSWPFDRLRRHRINRPTLYNLFANPIHAGAYVYGLRPTDRRRQKLGRPGTGRRAPRVETAEVVLPDRVPAYISWEQYQRNRAQMQANVAARGGPTRAGSALLWGVLLCGCCGLRMNAQYNNNGYTGRYICGAMKSSYGDPFCQSLKAAPLSRDVHSLTYLGMKGRLEELFVADPGCVNLRHFRYGFTPLFALPEKDDETVDIAAFLLARGADLEIRNRDGLTAEEIFRKQGREEIADFLHDEVLRRASGQLERNSVLVSGSM